MAGDAGYSRRRLVNRVAKKVQKELGLLAVSLKQCVVDYLGVARSRLRANLPTAVPRLSQHTRNK